MKQLLAIVLLSLVSACNARPPSVDQVQPTASIEVREPWVRESAGGTTVAAGYMIIANGAAAADRLVSVSSPRAGRVEIHEMAMDGGVMRMRAVDGGLALAAGETVTLAPGGLHLMFIDVATPFIEGESVPLTLTFEGGGAIQLAMPVRRSADQHGH